MNISDICDLLRRELFVNGYVYGFVRDGVAHMPDPGRGFDADFARLLETVYRVQPPEVTIQYKIGTCVDAVVVMKGLLDPLGVPNKIWLRQSQGGGPHTLLTFEADGKTVYLELTPQSKKPWYGKALVYATEGDLLEAFAREGYGLTDITRRVVVGQQPEYLLQAYDT